MQADEERRRADKEFDRNTRTLFGEEGPIYVLNVAFCKKTGKALREYGEEDDRDVA